MHNEPARASELCQPRRPPWPAGHSPGCHRRCNGRLRRSRWPTARAVLVEQFFEDIARPILKEWLDANLPGIIERLVQKEIQKIARRADLM